MTSVFNMGFMEYSKIAITGVLIYAIIFVLLKKIKVFGENEKMSSLIALLTAVLVSFSGVVTYAVSYMINWFTIILFVVFLLVVLLMFLGVDSTTIGTAMKNNKTTIMIVFFILFAVIMGKSFFAVNNSFDNNEPLNDSYTIDTSFNTGVDDITNKEVEKGWFQNLWSSMDPELLGVVGFLLIIGVFVMLIGGSGKTPGSG